MLAPLAGRIYDDAPQQNADPLGGPKAPVNDLQTLFSIVFGIYFAATVGAVGRFHPFDTTAAAAGDLRALARTIVGLVFLDILPLVYFLTVLRLLASNSAKLGAAWVPSIGVLFAGLGGFGIYRVLMALFLLRRAGGRYLFYSEADEVSNPIAKGHAERHKPEYGLPGESLYVLIGGAAWLVVCASMFWLTV